MLGEVEQFVGFRRRERRNFLVVRPTAIRSPANVFELLRDPFRRTERVLAPPGILDRLGIHLDPAPFVKP